MKVDQANPSLLKVVRRLWGHLTPRRRFQLFSLVVLMIISGLSELLTMGALVPFLMVLSDPQKLQGQLGAKIIIAVFHPVGRGDELVIFGMALSLAVIASSCLRSLTLYVNGRIAGAIGHDLSVEAFSIVLRESYEVHANRNSSETISKLNSVEVLIAGVLQPLLLAITSSFLALTVSIALLVVQPGLALGIGFASAAIYGLVYRVSESHLREMNASQSRHMEKLLRVQQEGLGAIRDVIMGGHHDHLISIYRSSDKPLRTIAGDRGFLVGSPRYVIEAASITLLTGSAVILSRLGGIATALPAIGFLVLALQRLLPAIQETYSSLTYARSNRYAIDAVLSLSHETALSSSKASVEASSSPSIQLVEVLPFSKEIRFENVCYAYSEARGVINDMSFVIEKGSRVGIVGSSGSGKSTIADLLMGLLTPRSGQILIDGVPLFAGAIDRRESWRQQIAHVPQMIFLLDASIQENIAFGVPGDVLDFERVKEAASLAMIHEFISSLPQGYSTKVGERGMQLSGGQRQRLGIARAIYHSAPVLILDEATSALDTSTESGVMQSLEGLSVDLTIVIIAHRISAIQGCSQIIEINEGRLVTSGSFWGGQ